MMWFSEAGEQLYLRRTHSSEYIKYKYKNKLRVNCFGCVLCHVLTLYYHKTIISFCQARKKTSLRMFFHSTYRNNLVAKTCLYIGEDILFEKFCACGCFDNIYRSSVTKGRRLLVNSEMRVNRSNCSIFRQMMCFHFLVKKIQHFRLH